MAFKVAWSRELCEFRLTQISQLSNPSAMELSPMATNHVASFLTPQFLDTFRVAVTRLRVLIWWANSFESIPPILFSSDRLNKPIQTTTRPTSQRPMLKKSKEDVSEPLTP